jgi:ribulose-5-phosphate 4-epimerase/fuculose-1-phosphate aldolase
VTSEAAENLDLAERLDELAKAHRILAMLGHEDLTSGHLSWRDPAGRGLWMKRSRIGMDEAWSADDMILIDFDGKQLAGSGSCHVEWPIHAEILRSRPEVNAVGHTHAFYSQIFSTTDEPLRPVGKQGAWFDEVPKFRETCNLIRTPELGRSLATTLAGNDAVFMMSHGIAFVGRTIREMTLVGVFLEKAVHAHVAIASSGMKYSWPSAEDIRGKRGVTRTERGIDNYWEYLERHLEPKRA